MIIPFNNLVLVKEIKQEKVHAGIILPEKHIGRYAKYEVLCVGSKVDWMKCGDIVLGNPTSSDEELEDGSKFINSADLFGRIE